MPGGSKGQHFTVLVAPSSCSVRSGFGPQTNSSWSSRTASSRLFSLIGRLRLAGFISKSHGSNCLTIPRRGAGGGRRGMTAPLRQSLDDAGRAALREVAPDIVTEFRGEPNRKLSTRKEMRWGARVRVRCHRRVKGRLWFDHEIGRGGDIIGFIELERGCSFVDALDHAAQYVSELRNGHHSSRPASRPTPRQTVDDDGDDEKRIRQALAIWCDARPLKGTIAEKYLRSRYIEVPGEALEVLRFHPRCPWGIGTQRRRWSRWSATSSPTNHRASTGPRSRSTDASWTGPSCWDRPPAAPSSSRSDYRHGNELTIGEGIETTLSAMILGFGPAWSVIDAGGIAKISGNALAQAPHHHRRQ